MIYFLVFRFPGEVLGESISRRLNKKFQYEKFDLYSNSTTFYRSTFNSFSISAGFSQSPSLNHIGVTPWLAKN